MNNIIKKIEQAQMRTDIPDFKAGDTVIVKVRVKEGTRERLQAYEGVVVAKRNRGINSAFTVRKIASGEGVERVFQTHSKMIESVTVKRRGDVRRAKLYYLRERAGKAARIKEKITRKAAQEKIAAQISTEEKTIEAEEKQEQPEAKAKQTETKKEEQQPTEETPKAKQEKKEEPKVETENKKDEDTATEKNAE